MKLKNIRYKNIIAVLIVIFILFYAGFTLVSGKENDDNEVINSYIKLNEHEMYGLLKKDTVLSSSEGKTDWDNKVKENVLVYYVGKNDIDKYTTVYEYKSVKTNESYFTTIIYVVEDISFEEAMFLINTELEMVLLSDRKVKNTNPNSNFMEYETKNLKKGEKVYPLEIVIDNKSKEPFVKILNEKGKKYFVELKYLSKN